EQLVLLNRTSEGISVVVTPQHLLVTTRLSRALTEEEILGIQIIVSPEIEDVAMKLVPTALGYNIDLGAARSPIFWPIAISLNFELINPIDGWIDQNGALRTDVIVGGPAHRPLIVNRWRTAKRNVHASE